MGRYIYRQARLAVKDLPEQCAAAAKAIAYPESLFGPLEIQGQLERDAGNSRWREHLAEAVYRTREDGGDVSAFFSELARQGFEATRGLLDVQHDYRDDDEVRAVVDKIAGKAIDLCAALLAGDATADEVLAAKPALVPTDLVEIVIARAPT